MANLAILLSSGKYSDLTLVCEDQEFQVHKGIVCSQSPVLDAALKGNFQEAKTNTFHVVTFNPTTVKCMLDYMYTGNYAQTPSSCCNESKDQAQTTENDKDCSVKSDTETWLHHGFVNCVADYFCVPELAKMAVAALDKLTREHWSEDAFCDLMYGTHGRTGDDGFRVMMATRAVDHLGELTARGLFNGADPPSDEMTPTILGLCAQRLNESSARADTQARELVKITDILDYARAYCLLCRKFTALHVEQSTESFDISP
ncbi:BTB/POZ protein [Xylaria telfairii]|nr:BTB/POZ protein [Xylaria telfairii]